MINYKYGIQQRFEEKSDRVSAKRKQPAKRGGGIWGKRNNGEQVESEV
jgi:hypothetical protein